jgi:hypothetical protein
VGARRRTTPRRPSATSAPTFTPGSEGIGDPYFPTYGNGGYDVAAYDLKLRYDPKSGELEGSATITATATQDLSAFNLDLAHLTAQKVTVDGRAASSRANLNELVVTPAAGIVNGRPFTVVVDYSANRNSSPTPRWATAAGCVPRTALLPLDSRNRRAPGSR